MPGAPGQGDVQAAAAAARRLLGDTDEPPFRAWLLGAMVEVLLADGDVAAARAAADELARFGAAFDSPLLRAAAGSAAGAVLLSVSRSRPPYLGQMLSATNHLSNNTSAAATL